MVLAILILGVAAGLVLTGIEESRRSRLVGDGLPAPEFNLLRFEGGTVSLASLRGRVVMLDFWATWCPPCVREMPALVKVAREYEERGLVFVAANRDDPSEQVEVVSAFVSRRVPELARSVAFADDQTARRYQISSMPTLYLIDPEGNVADAHTGAASEEEIRSWIERVLSR